MRITYSWRYWFLGVLALGALLLCAVMASFTPAVEEYVSQQRFDSSRWKTAESAERLTMVDDLLQRHALVGMSRAQVDVLLGKPSKTGYFATYDYVYWLGPERSFIAIDSEWLVLDFEGDVVSKVVVTKD